MLWVECETLYPQRECVSPVLSGLKLKTAIWYASCDRRSGGR